MSTTRVRRQIRAPRALVYRALLDADADGGTRLEAVHEGLPPGVAPADNELGWTLSLGKLASLVEGQGAGGLGS